LSLLLLLGADYYKVQCLALGVVAVVYVRSSLWWDDSSIMCAIVAGVARDTILSTLDLFCSRLYRKLLRRKLLSWRI